MKNIIFQIIDDVECYHGYKRNEKPLSFVYQNKQWRIIDIIDRWYEGGIKQGSPVKNYFKVITEEGRKFLLRYNPKYDSWAVQIEKKKD